MRHHTHTQNPLLGIGLVLASTVAFSLSGVLTKAIESDTWTVACWRGLLWSCAVARRCRRRADCGHRGTAAVDGDCLDAAHTATIYPQPHDIPMQVIVTASGIFKLEPD